MAKTITTDQLALIPNPTTTRSRAAAWIKRLPVRWLVGGLVGATLLLGYTYQAAIGAKANELLYTLQVWMAG